jgi:hypothetical protein
LVIPCRFRHRALVRTADGTLPHARTFP